MIIRAIDRNPRARGVLRTIIALGRTLGLPVTAEGIETEHECELLKDLGCHFGQGYLFGRPADAVTTRALLSENRDWSKRTGPSLQSPVPSRA